MKPFKFSCWGFISLLVCLILIQVAFTTYAAPKSNKPVSLTQPNGSTVECYVSGDEFFNYLHDASGNLIMRHPETGYYVYAGLNAGGKLEATNQTVVSSNDQIEIMPLSTFAISGVAIADIDFNINAGLVNKKMEPTPASEAAIPLVGAASANSARAIPVTGRMENVVVMICFADENPSISANISNKIQAVFNGSTNSLKDYMKVVSKGLLEVNSTLVGMNGNTLVMYKAAQTRPYYQPYNSSRNTKGYKTDSEAAQREHALLRDVVNAINGSSLLAGKNLDIDNNGKVDDITFIISGDVDNWSDLLWPHKWNLYTYDVTLNGKRVYEYSFQLLDDLFPANGNADLGVICHETLHVFGFPDLYRYTDLNSAPVSVWDVMAQGVSGYGPQFPNSHSVLRYGGWGSDLVEITQNGRYTLYPLGSKSGTTAYAIAIAKSDQFILLEYRNKNNGTKYDPHFGGFSGDLYRPGLTVTRVNTAFKGNANTATGATGRDDEVYVYRPSETVRNAGAGGIWGGVARASLSSDTGRTSFGNASGTGYNGTIYLHDGSNTNIVISNVSSAGVSISFDVKIQESTTVARNSTVNPATVSYSKNSVTEPKFTLSLNGNTLRQIRNATTILVAGKDYTVNNNICTIKSSYLNTQNVGNLVLTFEMSAGANPTAIVVISGTTPTNAQAPLIVTQPQGGSIVKNGTFSMSVNAVSLDGGTLSYQWYRYTGSAWTAISGATASTYSARFTTEGTFYLYVQVRNTKGSVSGSKTAGTASASVKVIVSKSAATVAVTDITGVPSNIVAGTSLTLAGKVIPTNATNRTIIWSLKNAGTTGATLNGSTLKAKTSGTVTVTATISNGLAAGKAYSKDFKITVGKGSTQTQSTYRLVVTAGVGGSLGVSSQGSGSSSMSQSSTQNGTVMSGTYTSGMQITLTATTQQGFSFKGWQIVSGGIVLSNPAARSITFVMPSSNVEIKAIFE